MIVPLGIGSYNRADAFVPEVVLRNMYLEQDNSGVSPDKTLRVQRPGLAPEYTYPAAIRAVHYRTSTGERLVVSGSNLYSSEVSKGFVKMAPGMVAIASTQFASFIVSDQTAYAYTTTVAEIALPADSPSGNTVQDVDQLNNYALLLQPNGRFYWIVPGAVTVDPLNFATAESLPDKGVALRRLGDEFWIFGSENIEVWQPTGDQDAPFQRAAGRNFERGCLHRDSVRRFDNTLVWVGDDYQVYRASSVPQIISNPGMAERIRKASGPCSAWTFGVDGHSFYVLRVPGQGSFAYDASTQAWSEFASLGAPEWLAWAGTQANNVTVAGSSADGRLWRVEPQAVNDAGVAIECIATATVPILGKPPRNDSLSIGIGASGDCAVRVRWKDGQDDFPNYYDEMEVRAPLDVAIMWRLGQPDQPYRTIEVSKVDPAVSIRIAGMVANESWA